MRNIGIIGGAGFLGMALQRKFRDIDVDVECYDLSCSKDSVNYLDVALPMGGSRFDRLDSIVNLAAEHRDDVRPKSRYDYVNVEGAKNVCNMAVEKGIQKIVFTSSVAIYGFSPVDTDESGEPNYFNDYGRTKYFAEEIYKEWQAEDPKNRTLVIVRPTVIFGEGNRGNVYNLLKQIASGRFIMFGNGINRKSMAYVENVAAFLEYSLSFEPGLHIYNYIDKPDLDMNTLVTEARKTLFGQNNVGLRLPAFLGMTIGVFADLIAKLTGKTLPVSSIRVKKFMGTTQFASSISETGFVPPVSLEEGLARTLRYEFLEDNSDKQTFETE
ncbi:NAD-dependent epimerase/dehydratase family protein [Porticoccaceae bacterium]|nr:NAD-dependent epimerase/dehydratase family protein [Porticoccaceae bacterium]|tara:strand:- start:176 stop:1156 length:981 start_codon:yes stop_codon:yes gene_type:complete